MICVTGQSSFQEYRNLMEKQRTPCSSDGPPQEACARGRVCVCARVGVCVCVYGRVCVCGVVCGWVGRAALPRREVYSTSSVEPAYWQRITEASEPTHLAQWPSSSLQPLTQSLSHLPAVTWRAVLLAPQTCSSQVYTNLCRPSFKIKIFRSGVPGWLCC